MTDDEPAPVRRGGLVACGHQHGRSLTWKADSTFPAMAAENPEASVGFELPLRVVRWADAGSPILVLEPNRLEWIDLGASLPHSRPSSKTQRLALLGLPVLEGANRPPHRYYGLLLPGPAPD
jgi:hypothetical protein